MVGYINSVRDREYKICTPEIFEQLVQSPMVTTHIEEYRKGNEKSKSLLPAFLFQGYDPNVLLGKRGSRLAKALKPTGFFIMDFDHIENPHKVYDTFLKRLPSLGFDLHKDVALAHVTPSGQGLRLVLVTPKDMTIEAAQEWVAKIMEIECDAVVKDLSRLSFCPMASDILYINKALLFAPIESYAKAHEGERQGVVPTMNCGVTDGNVAPQQAGAEGMRQAGADRTRQAGVHAQTITADSPHGSGAATSPSVTPYGATAECGDESDTPNNRAASTTPSIFPETYNGIPYKRIVEELILLHGGEPQVGNRENTIFRLASDLAKITDRSAPWLESLIPTFGLPEPEWRTTISQVCKKPLETSMSRKLQEAIKRCEAVRSVESAVESEENGENMPPALPEKLPRLIELLTSKVMPFQKPAVATMVFPALATYVNDAQFYMHDDDVTELSMMAVLTGKQSIGKSCINKPIKHILARIAAQDDINRLRIKVWAEKKKNKKQSERGESMPSCPVRLLSSDTSSAAFLLRLEAAEKGDEQRKNLCTYTHVDEIEELYKFCTTGGKTGIRQQIKKAWDRAETGSERATENAVNVKTVLRWNWTASTTIEMCRQFFDKCLVGGETSRVDFCTMIAPMVKTPFKYGRYDLEFRERLKPYIDNLENYKCERDEDGSIIPARYERIDELIGRVLDYMEKTADAEVDETYADYGKRAVIMAFKKLLILYIANGCVWEDEFEPFIWWSFKYSMWCKMNLFYEKASQKFIEEQIVPSGKRSPLKYMSRRFTMAEFTEQCRKMGLNTPPFRIISRYKGRGVVAQVEDGFVVSDEFCRKFGIK